jgi:hypothetical protein
MKYLTSLILILLFIQFGCKEQGPVEVENQFSVKIVKPSDSSVVYDTVTISVTATSSKGIKRGVLLIDDTVVDTFLTTPYSYHWNASELSDSSVHKIYAKAFDNENNTTSSPVVSVLKRKLGSTNLKIIEFSKTKLSLQWQNISTVDNQVIIEMSADTTNYSAIGSFSANTTSCTINGQYDLGKTYYVRIGAKADSCVIYSKPLASSPFGTSIIWPVALGVVVDTCAITLETSNDANISKVEIFIDGVSVQTLNTAPFTFHWNLMSISDNSSHEIYAKGYNKDGVSSASSPIMITAKKLMPVDVAILQMTTASVTLNWKDNSSIETSYVVEMSTDSINYTQLGEYPANTTSCTINMALNYDQKYYFRVGGKTDILTHYATPVSSQLNSAVSTSVPSLNYVKSTERTSDGGYVIAAFTSVSSLYLIKTDKDRNITWTKPISFGSGMYPKGCAVGDDGGYYITYESWVGNSRSICMMKLNVVGTEEWHKYVVLTNYSTHGNVIRRLADGNFIIAGYSVESAWTYLSLIKVDGNGNALSEKYVQMSGFHSQFTCYDIGSTGDGGYICASDFSNAEGGSGKFLSKIDSTGKIIWQTSIPSVQTDNTTGLKITGDGGCVYVAGKVITKVSIDGAIILQKSIGTSDSTSICTVSETADQGFVLGGYLYQNGIRRALLMKVDASGNTVWTKTYGAAKSQNISCIVKSAEGGYMLSGEATLADGSTAVLLIKTDENGDVKY